MAKFVKGQIANPKGRPKGSPNKYTQLREDFLKVYEAIGGSDGFTVWAKKNKTVFYKELAKLLPKDVNIGLQEGVSLKIDISGEDGD